METKVVTIRLPLKIYEQLCRLSDESEELPSETARKILRESLKSAQGNSEEEVIIAEEIPYDDDN
jgi:hypothetical protein